MNEGESSRREDHNGESIVSYKEVVVKWEGIRRGRGDEWFLQVSLRKRKGSEGSLFHLCS